MNLSDQIALAALILSVVALGLSIHFWRRSFRPIVTAMVRTNKAGDVIVTYDLTLKNSGSIPARNISLYVHDQRQLEAALEHAPQDRRAVFLRCFDRATHIPIIHNDAEVSCSFGFTGADGFWKPQASFPITIRYEGWFGKVYTQAQVITITDSTSFTGYVWNAPRDTDATWQHRTGENLDVLAD